MPLTVPTWIAAIATAVLAVGAGFTVYYARKAFREQSKEVGLLQQQVEQANQERRREQASRVFIWQERHSDIHPGQAEVAAGGTRGERVTVHVKNSSEQPVYDPELRWYLGTDPAPGINSEPLSMLLPGEDDKRSRPILLGASPSQFGATLRFRDANAVRWNRYPDGQLFEQ